MCAKRWIYRGLGLSSVRLRLHVEPRRRGGIWGSRTCHLSLPGGTGLRTLIQTWSFFPVAALAIAVPSSGKGDRRVVVGCLVWLIALYPLSAVWR